MTDAATATIMVTLPTDLKMQLDSVAKEAHKSMGGLVREWIANEMGYELPAFGRAHYANPEEAKRVRAEKKQARKDLVDRLLEAYFSEHPEAKAEMGL